MKGQKTTANQKVKKYSVSYIMEMDKRIAVKRSANQTLAMKHNISILKERSKKRV